MPEFCEICGVTMDLHDMTAFDPCGEAEEEADRLERIERMMLGAFVR